jgi:hypothetical protein
MSEQISRAVELLSESASAWRVHAPQDAAAMEAAVAVLRGVAAASTPHRLLTPAAKRAAADEVRSWMLKRLENWSVDEAPPTQAEDIRAAAADLPGIPRNYIIAARPPEWPLKEGRPKTRR